MSRDPETIAALERAKQNVREWNSYYRQPVYFGGLTAVALFEIITILWPGHFADRFHTLSAALRVGAIWAIALADWIAKRRWLKRHPELHDFPMPNTVFALALFAFSWENWGW